MSRKRNGHETAKSFQKCFYYQSVVAALLKQMWLRLEDHYLTISVTTFFCCNERIAKFCNTVVYRNLWWSTFWYLWKWPPGKSTHRERMCLRSGYLHTVILASSKSLVVGGWCHIVRIFIGPVNAVLQLIFPVKEKCESSGHKFRTLRCYLYLSDEKKRAFQGFYIRIRRKRIGKYP